MSRYTKAGLLVVTELVCLTLAAMLVSVAVGMAIESWCGCVVMALCLIVACIVCHVLITRMSKESDDGAA